MMKIEDFDQFVADLRVRVIEALADWRDIKISIDTPVRELKPKPGAQWKTFEHVGPCYVSISIAAKKEQPDAERQ